MKRFSYLFSLCLATMLLVSCLNADRTKSFSEAEDSNHVTSDELMFEIETAEMKTASYLFTADDDAIATKGHRLNNSTLQEMLVVYNHLIMSESQILMFENNFNTKVKESSQNLPTQIEIQQIMDVSFENVLTEDQFHKYNDWRIVGSQ